VCIIALKGKEKQNVRLLFVVLTRKRREFISIWDEFCLDVDGMREDRLHEKKKKKKNDTYTY